MALGLGAGKLLLLVSTVALIDVWSVRRGHTSPPPTSGTPPKFSHTVRATGGALGDGVEVSSRVADRSMPRAHQHRPTTTHKMRGSPAVLCKGDAQGTPMNYVSGGPPGATGSRQSSTAGVMPKTPPPFLGRGMPTAVVRLPRLA